MQLKVNDPAWQLQLESGPSAYARLAVDSSGDLALTVPTGRRVSLSDALSVMGAVSLSSTFAVTGSSTLSGDVRIAGANQFASSKLTVAGDLALDGGDLSTRYIHGVGAGGLIGIKVSLATADRGIVFGSIDNTGAKGEWGRLWDPGVLAWGTTTTTGAGPGDVILKYTGLLHGVNKAGTGAIPMIGVGNLTNSDVVNIAPAGGQVTTVGPVTQVGGANPGDVVLANSKALRSVNAAGTGTVSLIHLNSVNRTVIGNGGDAVEFVNTLPIAGAAGALVGYGYLYYNGTPYKFPLYNP